MNILQKIVTYYKSYFDISLKEFEALTGMHLDLETFDYSDGFLHIPCLEVSNARETGTLRLLAKMIIELQEHIKLKGL